MTWKGYVRIGFAILVLYALYCFGVSVNYLAIIALLLVVAMLMKGPAYKKIDDALAAKFPFISKWPPLGRKLLVVMVFIAAYALLKQLFFELLKTVGIDVQQAMFESLNKSLGG